MFKKQKFSFSSLFQLAFLVLGLILAVFLTDQAQKYLGRAGSSPVPKEVTITNPSENSFTVSWLTDKPASGAVILTEGTVFFDDRSAVYTSNSLFTTHQVTLSNLKSGQSYSFQIQSGKDKSAVQYQTATLTPAKTPALLPAMVYGTAVNSADQPLHGVLVYLTSKTASQISTLTDQNGNFVLNLTSRRTLDLTDYFPPQAGETATLTLKLSPAEISYQEIVLTATDQNLGSLTVGEK